MKPGSAATRVFLGADIVDVLRTMPTTNTETLLGEKIVARDAAGTRQPLDLNVEWLAAPVKRRRPIRCPTIAAWRGVTVGWIIMLSGKMTAPTALYFIG